MLQKRCWCRPAGVVQGWTRTSSATHECDDCGEPLAWIESFPVPDDMRPALRILAALVDPSPMVRAEARSLLPEPIRDADRSRMFRLIVAMANDVDPDAAHRSIEEPRERLYGLWSACDALMRWPTGIEGLTWAKGVSSTSLRRTMNEWTTLLPHEASRPHLRRSGTVANDGPVGIRRATEVARLSPEVLLTAWDNGLVTQHRRRHGEKTMAAFDPAELVALGDAWYSRVAPDTVAHDRLGVSLHGVEQLVAIGELVADGPSIPGTDPHFRPETVDAYVSCFTAPGAWTALTDAVRLIDVMRRIGKRAKPWGPVLKMLRDGTIPFDLSEDDVLVRRILISAESARKVVAATFDRSDYETPGAPSPFSDRMVQRDVVELLNASPNLTAAQIGLAPTGRNPKTYPVAEIERIATEIVMIPEISALTGHGGPTILQRLIRDKAVPIRPGVYSRSILD